MRLKFAETLTKMVKDTVQSLKLQNDKLKDKIQDICAELRNLRDEVKAERNGDRNRLFVNLLGASPVKVLWQPVEK